MELQRPERQHGFGAGEGEAIIKVAFISLDSNRKHDGKGIISNVEAHSE